MFRKSAPLLLFVAVFLLSNGPLVAATANPKLLAPVTAKYTDRIKGFSVMLPAKWEQKANEMGAAVIALRPLAGKNDQFRENINIVMEALDQKMTSRQYYNASQTVLKKVFTEYHVEKNGHTTIDGHDYYWSVFTHRLGAVRAKVLQYMTADGNRAFVITGSALPTTFNAYLPEFQAVAKTMNIIKREVANKK